MDRVRLSAWLVILVSVVLAVWRQPGLIRFWPFTATEFVQLITPLVLVALFMERSMEVFLTAWRAGRSAMISREIERLKATHAKESHEVKEQKEQLENARDRLAEYKSETQRIAFIWTLAIGIVISALGIRALELFVDPAAFADLSATQRTAFNAADILLTGGLLGGGSEGLHKIVAVFTNFMDKTSKRVKGEEG